MNTVRTNITIDSELKTKATEMASELGLSFSALVRLLLSKMVNKERLTSLEEGVLDYMSGDVIVSSGEDYLKELQKDINKYKRGSNE